MPYSFFLGSRAISWRFFESGLSEPHKMRQLQLRRGRKAKDIAFHVHVAIDCQMKSHDNGGLVARERNCTITVLTKKARFDDEQIVRAY